MYGATMGTLRLVGRTVSGTYPRVEWHVWSKVGQVANAWRRASVTISSSLGITDLRFRYRKGTSYTGDAAVDDLSVLCVPVLATQLRPPPSPSPPPLSPRPPPPSPSPPPCRGSAMATHNFESPSDGWGRYSSGYRAFTRYSATTPSTATGPRLDHTPGVGRYYFYAETSSPAPANAQFELYSTRGVCACGGVRSATFWWVVALPIAAAALCSVGCGTRGKARTNASRHSSARPRTGVRVRVAGTTCTALPWARFVWSGAL